MGASSSTDQDVSAEQKEVESLAASTGALPMLQNAFSKLANPQTNTIPIQSLQVRPILGFIVLDLLCVLSWSYLGWKVLFLVYFK